MVERGQAGGSATEMHIASTAQAERKPSFCPGSQTQLPALPGCVCWLRVLGGGEGAAPAPPQTPLLLLLLHPPLFSFHPKSPFSSPKNLPPPQETCETSPPGLDGKVEPCWSRRAAFDHPHLSFPIPRGIFFFTPRWWRHPGVSSPLPNFATALGAALEQPLPSPPGVSPLPPRFSVEGEAGWALPSSLCPSCPPRDGAGTGTELCHQPGPIPQLCPGTGLPLPPPCTWDMVHIIFFNLFFSFSPIFSPLHPAAPLQQPRVPLCWVPVR